MSLEPFDTALTDVEHALRRRDDDRAAVYADVLGQIGTFAGADLVFLYLSPVGEPTRLVAEHRWARAGAEGAWEVTPGAPIMDFAHYRKLMKEQRLVRVDRAAELPASAVSERLQVERRGIKSVLMLRAFSGSGAVGVLSLYALRAETHWSDEQVSFARHAGALLGHAIARELSERRRDAALDELRALELGVQGAQRLESLGVLAGGIAHDFNNLLTAILGNAELALLRVESAEQRTRLERVVTAAKRAADLANQMLAYSGRGRFQLHSLDVNALIEETGELLHSSLPRTAELRLSLTPGLPAVYVDAPQIRQVVMNLILNAAQSLPEGVGSVTLSTDVVSFSEPRSAFGETLEPGTYVRIRVSDTGCGMEPAALQRIFDPFYTTKLAGRGLGLAAVQGIVRGHAGGLWVQSTPGAGSTFTVVLPQSEASVTRQESIGRGPDGPVPRFQGRVLLADDEVDTQQALRALLEELGLEVQSSCDGVEAVARFQLDPAGYDLVVLDLTMPALGGGEACRRIRELRPDVPVLLTSGFDEQEVGSLSSEPGVRFVQKPVSLDALAKALAALRVAASRSTS